MQPQPITVRVKEVVRRVLDLSVGAKLLIGSAIGALGGSTLIGFISEYATYSFAFNHGARMPVEGVPYLKLAVTLVSSAIFGSALFCFGVMYWVLLQTLKRTTEYARGLAPAEALSLEELPLRKYLAVAIPAVLLATLPLIFGILANLIEVIMGQKNRSFWSLVAVFSYLAFATILVILARKPKSVKWVVTVLSLLLVIGISVSLFVPQIYGEFLRGIRFGGGIEVTIQRTCEELANCSEEESGYLFLRTRETAILYKEGRSVYVEIPVGQIRRYEYRPNPRWKLPPFVERGAS